MVRVGASLVDIAVSRGPSSQILVAMSDRTVLLANNNSSSIIWSYIFPPSMVPRSVAIDEQGNSAVIYSNSSSSTTFGVSVFDALGQWLTNITYSSLSVGVVQMTSDYGGIMWVSAQSRSPTNDVPLLHAFSTTNFTRLYTLWDYTPVEHLALFNGSGAAIRRLHYGPDKQLYFLSGGFGSNSVLRTDGRDANTNILTVNVTDTGSIALIGRIDPASSRVVLGQFNIQQELFGPPTQILYRAAASIAANRNGEVWIASSAVGCLSGSEVKRINCIKLSNCSGDAFVLKLTRNFTRLASWTPVALSGLSNSRAFIASGANRTVAFFQVASNISEVNFFTTNSSAADGSPSRIGRGNSTDLWLGIWQDPQPITKCDRQIVSDVPKFANLDSVRLSLLPPSDPVFTAPGSIFAQQPPYFAASTPVDSPRDSAVVTPTTAAVGACSTSPGAAIGGIVACVLVGVLILILATVALIHPSVHRICRDRAPARRSKP
eukprot:TRINITY_DN3560_c0_g3_i1.p1 TRINITY_DN3560_c0_g3~~TRINITY_DN3560_c0_g3_i1.p1  ORF type:complete len:490 (-),score=55.01 TRINITY_DN3560_c0_g3_i1:120-1589(-)